MKYCIIILLTFLVFSTGCQLEIEKKPTFRLLESEREVYKAYTDPNVALYENPEDEARIDSNGKFIYLGWLDKEGRLPGNPYRSTRYTCYSKSDNKEMRKIDADMWWLIQRHKDKLEAKIRKKASVPKVYKY